VSQEWQKHSSFVQAKYSLGVKHLYRGCKAADYLLKVLKMLMVYSMLGVKNVLVRESGGVPLSPPPSPGI